MKNILQKIAKNLLAKHGTDISIYDQSFLERSVNNRLQITGTGNTLDYIDLLENSDSETKALLESLQVTYSEFFRYPLSFFYIEQFILPAIIQKKKNKRDKEIRCWSCACSEGQEPYSIAIIWNEIVKNLREKMDCRIFATDLNPEALNKAKKGVYDIKNLRNTSFERVEKNFIRHSDTFVLNSKIRDYVDFSSFDLLSGNSYCPPVSIFGNFDMIFCCNLLFYFNSEYRNRILEKVIHCLSKDGFLVTGEAEREIVSNYNLSKFKEVFPSSAIFQKLGYFNETAKV